MVFTLDALEETSCDTKYAFEFDKVEVLGSIYN